MLLWGWGVMNSTALKEAQATGYPPRLPILMPLIVLGVPIFDTLSVM